jgi:enoyl-CoA hydratase/carnithine racemase
VPYILYDRVPMLILTPDDLSHCDARAVEEIAAAPDFVVAIGAGELSGYALAAALHSDWFALDASATLDLNPDSGRSTQQSGLPRHSTIWAGVISRIGVGALRLCLLSGARFMAFDALREQLADAVVPAGKDPVEWVRDWIGGRSTAALESAAALIRRRGGDTLERAEFARLFATGEPHEGLSAFLAKRKPDFNREVTRFRGHEVSPPRDPQTSEPEKR